MHRDVTALPAAAAGARWAAAKEDEGDEEMVEETCWSPVVALLCQMRRVFVRLVRQRSPNAASHRRSPCRQRRRRQTALPGAPYTLIASHLWQINLLCLGVDRLTWSRGYSATIHSGYRLDQRLYRGGTWEIPFFYFLKGGVLFPFSDFLATRRANANGCVKMNYQICCLQSRWITRRYYTKILNSKRSNTHLCICALVACGND